MTVPTAAQIGNRIKEIRLKRGLSQLELARDAGTHQSNLSGWERGRRDIFAWTLARLAATLDVSTDYLLLLTDDPSPARERQ